MGTVLKLCQNTSLSICAHNVLLFVMHKKHFLKGAQTDISEMFPEVYAKTKVLEIRIKCLKPKAKRSA
jgi:hypothetical protein